MNQEDTFILSEQQKKTLEYIQCGLFPDDSKYFQTYLEEIPEKYKYINFDDYHQIQLINDANLKKTWNLVKKYNPCASPKIILLVTILPADHIMKDSPFFGFDFPFSQSFLILIENKKDNTGELSTLCWGQEKNFYSKIRDKKIFFINLNSLCKAKDYTEFKIVYNAIFHKPIDFSDAIFDPDETTCNVIFDILTIQIES